MMKQEGAIDGLQTPDPCHEGRHSDYLGDCQVAEIPSFTVRLLLKVELRIMKLAVVLEA